MLPDEKGANTGFLTLAGTFFTACGIHRIKRIPTDNAPAYRRSEASTRAVADLGAVQRFITPPCPWTNGKTERFNRTLATDWAYRRPYTGSHQRAAALDPWLRHYNTERIDTGIGTTTIKRVSPT